MKVTTIFIVGLVLFSSFIQAENSSIFEQLADQSKVLFGYGVYHDSKNKNAVEDGNHNIPGTSFPIDRYLDIIIQKELGNFVVFWHPLSFQTNKWKRWNNGALIDWTAKLAKHHIYSSAMYCDSCLSPDLLLSLQKNPYWIGNFRAEVNSFLYQSKSVRSLYGIKEAKNLEEARNQYVNFLANKIKENKKRGYPYVICAGGAMFTYETGLAHPDICDVETFFQNTSFLISEASGATYALGRKAWSAYNPSDWYSKSLAYSDPRKFMLLRTTQYLEYIYGATMLTTESGIFNTQAAYYTKGSYGKEPNYGFDSYVCKNYRREGAHFFKFLQNHHRKQLKPDVDIAVVKGRFSGYIGNFGFPLKNQPVYGQWEKAEKNPAWYIGAPEAGWDRINDTLLVSQNHWLCGTPYGQVDIIPAEADASILSTYKLLLFIDWNSMNQTILQNLKKSVETGTTIFMSLVHFNKSLDRAKWKVTQIDKGMQTLIPFSGEDKGKTIKTIQYKNKVFKLKKTIPVLSISSGIKNVKILAESEEHLPVLVQYKIGKGFVILNLLENWPGQVVLKEYMDSVITDLAHNVNKEVWLSEVGTQKVQGENTKKIAYTVRTNCIDLINVNIDKKSIFVLHVGERRKKIKLKPGEYLSVNRKNVKILYHDAYNTKKFLKTVPKSEKIKKKKGLTFDNSISHSINILVDKNQLNKQIPFYVDLTGKYQLNIATSTKNKKNIIKIDGNKISVSYNSKLHSYQSKLFSLKKGLHHAVIDFKNIKSIILSSPANDESVNRLMIMGLKSSPLDIAKNKKVSVSGTYAGYSSEYIVDGISIPDEKKIWNERAWASEESSIKTNIVEIQLDNAQKISQINIYWALDAGKWYASKGYKIEGYYNGKWFNLVNETNNSSFVCSSYSFKPIKIEKIRLVQPPKGGSTERPNLLWLGEIEILP